MRLLTWLLCTPGAFATTPPTTHTLHEKREGPADAWTKQSRAQQDVILPIRVALKQQNLDNGDRFLLDISDPDSPNFGRAPPSLGSFPLLIPTCRQTLDS